jgi:hypothetical protein
MHPRTSIILSTAFAFLGALLVKASVEAQPPASGIQGLPAMPPGEALPPLPAESPRNASYTIAARLDPEKHTIEGRMVLEWRNLGDKAVDTFPFHLYWNAFRNTLSTSAREGGSRGSGRRSDEDGRDYGWIHVTSARALSDSWKGGARSDESSAGETDILPTLRYVQPDDANVDDRTVMEVKTPAPVAPGATARFALEWTALIPHGTVGRAGWIHDYHFIVQWFPKIGVFWKGRLGANQFHAATEFFSDYGRYDVSLTLPKGHVVGATGRRAEARDNGDGTETLRYVQDDVHDFAWTASRRFLEKTDRFEAAGYPPVDIRLLVQPEHEHLSRRYLESTKAALLAYGAWGAPYPYPQVTVVDPAWNSSSGGMEYPTLFTGGARIFAPEILHSPEEVTVHEAGHQFWYGLVGNNEFEEAWLDEGLNSYHEEKTTWQWLGPAGVARYYFGPVGGRGSRTGWPVVAPGVYLGRGIGLLDDLRQTGQVDVMARRGWEYRTRDSYGLNSYDKPALSFQTLEGLVGDETMTRILRVYARRFRFAHPTSEDFIATVNEVTGRDYGWFFKETWYSSGLCDYAIDAVNERPPRLRGFRDSASGVPERVPEPREPPRDDEGPWESEVIVERRGDVRMPVEIRIVFADGSTKEELWDGQDRWKRLELTKKVARAYVDPERKIALDVDPANNTWVDEKGEARRAAAKWSARFLFWLQNLLELHTVLG